MSKVASRKFNVGKLEAAVSQLNTAIELWFREKDIAPIHALASAAFEVVWAIIKSRGLGDPLLERIKGSGEEGKKLAGRIKASQNFLKHADRDPEATFDFVEEHTEILLLFTVWGLDVLRVKKSLLINCYTAWYICHHPAYASTEDRKRLETHYTLLAEQCQTMEKKTFYRRFIGSEEAEGYDPQVIDSTAVP